MQGIAAAIGVLQFGGPQPVTTAAEFEGRVGLSDPNPTAQLEVGELWLNRAGLLVANVWMQPGQRYVDAWFAESELEPGRDIFEAGDILTARNLDYAAGRIVTRDFQVLARLSWTDPRGWQHWRLHATTALWEPLEFAEGTCFVGYCRG